MTLFVQKKARPAVRIMAESKTYFLKFLMFLRQKFEIDP